MRRGAARRITVRCNDGGPPLTWWVPREDIAVLSFAIPPSPCAGTCEDLAVERVTPQKVQEALRTVTCLLVEGVQGHFQVRNVPKFWYMAYFQVYMYTCILAMRCTQEMSFYFGSAGALAYELEFGEHLESRSSRNEPEGRATVGLPASEQRCRRSLHEQAISPTPKSRKTPKERACLLIEFLQLAR